MNSNNAPNDPLRELDQLLARIREAFVAQYRRGCEDTAARIVKAMSSSSAAGLDLPALGESYNPKGKKRARRGTPKAFVERALSDGKTTAREILESARTTDERQVSYSAIRLELQRGKNEKRYRNNNGKWTLI